MKKIIILLCIVSFCSCTGQSTTTGKKNTEKIKKDTMEYFNIERYKDWETDNDYLPNGKDKFLKKGNERIEIVCNERTIYIQVTNTLNPYGTRKNYYPKNKLLKSVFYEFYTVLIGTARKYDEIGKLVEEIDYDKPYKFSIKHLIEKVKKECNVDLENKARGIGVDRRIDENLKKPFYEVYIKSKDDIEGEYILIDGTTGETLFKSIYYTKGDFATPPFEKYLAGLKKKEEEDNAYFKTYQGKDYTKKEWKAFEEEWHKNHEENKNKGFWDSLKRK
jgi:hypothetical protein